ncbi:MAG: hypothetical protein PHC29_07855 [Candidatus Omnitrophica bacterium]|nr:hypothetical protein [Candidatus Omnitrophota bacterium]
MMKRIKALTIILSLLFFSVFLHKSYADQVEKNFKDLSLVLVKESSQTLSPTDKYENLIEELRNLVRANPHSIWAADAQYLIATFSVTDPQRKLKELEKILKDYPNIHLQDWTKEKLGSLLPKIVDEQIVRIELSILYKQLGETKKLKKLTEESIKKFPEKAYLFKEILNMK